MFGERLGIFQTYRMTKAFYPSYPFWKPAQNASVTSGENSWRSGYYPSHGSMDERREMWQCILIAQGAMRCPRRTMSARIASAGWTIAK
jgi:hypothetical protein